MRSDLAEKLENLPSGSGVYLLKDGAGRVVYVGKGKNLRKRVLSYYGKRKQLSPKTRIMIGKTADLEVLLTNTEKEALILEANLIKKYRPRYNVVLRDDKNYLTLRIDLKEEYPRLSLVRRIQKDGALYFGPFASAQAVRETLKILNSMFPLRQCTSRTFRKRLRPCLNYQMGRCLGLCAGAVSSEEYARVVEQAVLFLKGRTRDLQDKLREEMEKAASALEFEKAAMYRDRLTAVEKTLERQRVVSGHFRDQDVVGVYKDSQGLALATLLVRGGRLVGSRIFDFSRDQEESEAVRAFLQQYYAQGHDIPEEVLVSDALEEQDLLAEYLSDLKGRRVAVRAPRRGDGHYLLAMAVRNAASHLGRRRSGAGDARVALARLEELLGLATRPRRLECVDISNIQGRFAVGSLVVSQDGQPDKSAYRRYRIKSVDHANDTAMMAEVLRRRFAEGKDSEVLPDVLVVDGGKGQLNGALTVLRELDLEGRVAALGLAKESRARGREKPGLGERLYVPGRKNPLFLGREPALLALLARLRDEAHRFAVSYYQKRHRKGALRSRLDMVPGVGPKRRQALLRHFGSVRELAAASVEKISQVQGISRQLAEGIYAALQEKEVDSQDAHQY